MAVAGAGEGAGRSPGCGGGVKGEGCGHRWPEQGGAKGQGGGLAVAAPAADEIGRAHV